MLDPRDYLEVAMKISRNKDTRGEAWIRTAVSRCYYSAFLAAKRLLTPTKGAPHGNDLHRFVIMSMRKVDGGMADRLKYLYDQRIMADFNDDVPWSIDVINEVHCIAKVFNDDAESRSRKNGPPLQGLESAR